MYTLTFVSVSQEIELGILANHFCVNAALVSINSLLIIIVIVLTLVLVVHVHCKHQGDAGKKVISIPVLES